MPRLHVLYTDHADTELLGEILDQMPLPSSHDAKIALKPNLVVAKPSDSGATTDPALVEAVIRYLRDKGYRNITIMESSWIGDSTQRAFRVCGYEEISRKYQVPLVDLKKDVGVMVDVDGLRLEICQTALEADYLINFPVLKAHCQTKVTCALKNLKGCIPDQEKRRFHTLGLHRPIAALNKVLRSDLTIVDGIVGDLTFEEGGTPVFMGRIIVGTDPVAVDAYAADLLGYDPSEIAYIQLAESLGVGSANLASIEIVEYNRAEKSPVSAGNARRIVDRFARFVDEKDACSACYGSLMHALTRFEERYGRLPEMKIAIGQGFQNNSGQGYTLGIGKCTAGLSKHVTGCPPSAAKILHELASLLGR